MIEEKFYHKILGSKKDILRNRYLNGISKSKVKNLFVPELILKFDRIFTQKNISQLYKKQNSMYGELTNEFLKTIDYKIFHFVSGLGLEPIEDAKKKGALVICDTRSIYYKAEMELMKKEKLRSGYEWLLPEVEFFDRLDAEYEKSDIILVNSNFSKKTFIDAGFSENKIKTLHLGVDNKKFNKNDESTFDESKFRIAFVGTINERKGFHILFDAWKDFKNENTELILIGSIASGFKEEISKEKTIIALNHIPHSRIPKVLSSCSALVLPSIYDSFGLVGLEALSCGVPLITNSNCGVSELITDGLEGLIYNLHDSKDLHSKLNLLYKDKILLANMRKKAIAIAKINSWEVYQKRLVQITGSLL